MRTGFFTVAAAALLVVGFVTTGAAAAATADANETDRSQTALCDYETLYDETIGSVVAIRTSAGLGSGFAYSVAAENGTSHLVTNAHVVGDADSVDVQFARGDSRSGEVVGRDVRTDLAVIRVSETPEYVESLPLVEAPAAPGRAVAALGNPFGLDQSITHGIVSGTNRSMPTTRGYAVPNVVQTDAPINPGNSGGPLVTCNGAVVGVNTAGIQASRAENVGFAVSASVVRRVAPSLIESGEFDHPYLGAAVVPATSAIAEANDLNATDGVYVVSTAEGSPAAGALQEPTDTRTVNGMRIPVGGDLVVAVDGREIHSQEELASYLVTETEPGQTITLTVVRDGERREVDVALEERPEPRRGST